MIAEPSKKPTLPSSRISFNFFRRYVFPQPGTPYNPMITGLPFGIVVGCWVSVVGSVELERSLPSPRTGVSVSIAISDRFVID